MASDPICFRVECDPRGVIWFASPDKSVDVEMGLVALVGCRGFLGLTDVNGMALVRLGRGGLLRVVVRRLGIVGTRNDPGVEAAAVFVPNSISVVIPGAEASVGV